MLVYPFTFFTVNGITKVLRSIRKTPVRWKKASERALKVILVLPFSVGLVFMTSLGTSMQGNGIPLRDVNDTIRAMQWLDAQMDDGSVLLVHYVFSNWARLYLDERYPLICFKENVQRAINVALQHGFNDMYFVWWNEHIEQYGPTVTSNFTSVFESGRISVFVYGARYL